MHITGRGVVLGTLLVVSLALTGSIVAQQQPEPTIQNPPTEQHTPQSPSAPGKQPVTPGNQPESFSAVPGVLVSTETLLGSTLRLVQGEALGAIKQLLVEPRTGQVQYAVVAMGGFLGVGERTIIVPWHAMELTRDGRALVLQVAPRELPHTSVDAGASGASSQGSGAGNMEMPYERLYDPAKEQTIHGQVISTETGPPIHGMTSGIQMLVRTDGDQTARVHMGPQWYLERQEVAMPANTEVQVTGAVAEIDGQTMLLAREVQFNGHTLRLRDTQGIPMWSSLRRSAR
jgi:sporulation protein YlmC with PRC-barrel domain